MRMVRFVGMALLILGLPACSGKKNEDKIVGKWEVKESKEAPPGTVVEFTSGQKVKLVNGTATEDKILGKVIQTGLVGGQPVTVYGLYTVEGDKLTVLLKAEGEAVEKDWKPDEKAEKHTLKIKTLTDSSLVTEDVKGNVDEYKRK